MLLGVHIIEKVFIFFYGFPVLVIFVICTHVFLCVHLYVASYDFSLWVLLFGWKIYVCPFDPFSSVQELSKDFDPLVREAAPFTTRRALFGSIFMYPLCDPSRYLSGSQDFSFVFNLNLMILL